MLKKIFNINFLLLVMGASTVFMLCKFLERKNIEITQENREIIKDVDDVFSIVKNMSVIDIDEPKFIDNNLIDFKGAERVLVLQEKFEDRCSQDFYKNSGWWVRQESCAMTSMAINNDTEFYQKRISYLYRTTNGNWFILKNSAIGFLGYPREYPFKDLNKRFDKAYAYQDLNLITEDQAKNYMFERDKDLYLKYFKVEAY